MATLANATPAVKAKRQRTIRVTVPPSDVNPACVVTIRGERGKDTDYHVCPIPSDFGTAYEVTKMFEADDAVYHVTLDGNRSSCDCPGFCHHGHCKHVSGLSALRQAGRL
jgi:hypothetical protein